MFEHFVIDRISNSSRTEWSTVQGVIRRVISITSTISPELYDTKSYYQLIVSITKREKLFKSTVEKRLSKSKENMSIKVIESVNLVPVCFQSAPVNLLT